MTTRTRIAAALASAPLLLTGVLATSSAAAAGADSRPEPCAQQQKQVDKAEDALARVSAVFEKQKTKVKKAKREVAESKPGSDRAKARRALAHAKHDRAEAKSDKKAQVQRLARAEKRLADCQDDQADQPGEA